MVPHVPTQGHGAPPAYCVSGGGGFALEEPVDEEQDERADERHDESCALAWLVPADSLTEYNSADVWTRLRDLYRRGTLFPISEQASTEIASVHAGLQLVPDTRITGHKAR